MSLSIVQGDQVKLPVLADQTPAEDGEEEEKVVETQDGGQPPQEPTRGLSEQQRANFPTTQESFFGATVGYSSSGSSDDFSDDSFENFSPRTDQRRDDSTKLPKQQSQPPASSLLPAATELTESEDEQDEVA